MSSDTINKTNLWYTTKQVKKKARNGGSNQGLQRSEWSALLLSQKTGLKNNPRENIFLIAAHTCIKKKKLKKRNNSWFFFPAFSTRVTEVSFFFAFSPLEVPSATPPPRAL